MKFPSIAEVAAELTAIAAEVATYGIESDEEGETPYVDVRLQVTESGSWAVHSGDASYDTDHRGVWGASSIPADGSMDARDAREIARALIDEARDHAAQSE